MSNQQPQGREVGTASALPLREASSHSPEEVRETLEAISSGNVDAVVVDGPHGPQVFHLEGPDQPFRTFVERMQEGVLTLGADGTILYANTYFMHLLGLALTDVIGSPLARFVPSRYHSTLAAFVRDGLATTVKGAFRLESQAGDIPVQMTLSPLLGGSQPTVCVVVFDLREREQVEEAHAARVAAEEANKAKDQFLAVLSHELRSPLNTILGWAQILLGDPSLGEGGRRAVQTIERNARTQAGLIADLLDISRIIAGKLNLEMSHVELTALTESSLSAARPLFVEKGIELRQRIMEDADVYGDPTRLQQILTNLLNNALKFTEPGGVIDVALTEDDSWIVLTVADTGIGMTQELLSRVFEIFQQGGNPQRRNGGLGLGLAIAKQLAEAHGGTLSAASDGEGRGSVFTLHLPRARKSIRVSPTNFQPRGELEGLHALLVDDDRDNLDLTRYMLESAGCLVSTAESAETALAALEKGDFGLVVSDIGLPDQDGLELMREIRARGYGSDRLPAIALTGYAGLHDARLVTAAGYQRHLAKPVDIPGLLRAAAELGRKTL